jgi:molybdopterin synthase catalytic subunit
MKVTVKLFARFKEMVGAGTITTEVSANITIAELVKRLSEEFPKLRPTPEQMLLAVNREFATPETVLKDGDEVAIFPPVSGGTDSNKFALTYEPIILDKVTKMVTHPHTGAVVTFTGVVRNISEGKKVASLEYEAYYDMAITKMKQVAEEVRQKWPGIVDIAIIQRLGHLEVGDVAAVIAVSSSHRHDGCFEAAQYSIDRLKQIVPIWKKEIGPDGEEWVEGNFNPSLNED